MKTEGEGMPEVSADWRPPKPIMQLLEKVAEALGPYCEFIGCHVVQESPKSFEIEVFKLPQPEEADVQVSWLSAFFDDDDDLWINAYANASRKPQWENKRPFLEMGGRVEGLRVELWITLSPNECCAPPMVLDCKTKEWTYRSNHGCFHGNRGKGSPEGLKT